MPTLTLESVEEELEEERKKVDDEGGKKPVIYVLDPTVLHRIILNFVLGEAGLLNKVGILWHSQFSRTFIGLGGIDEQTDASFIAAKKPALLISELEVISGEPQFGLEMLENLRKTKPLRNTPLVVIVSNRECLTKVLREWEKSFKGLRASESFTWKSLENSPNERKRLVGIVSRALGL